MLFADSRARFNRRVVNQVVRPLSGRVALWSLIEHVGRRSGATHRTPVTVFRTPDGFAVLLPYGRGRDWVKNLQASGYGRIMFRGKTFDVQDPRIVPTAAMVPLLSPPWRAVVGRLRTPWALLLTHG
ncbi:MAG: nitroreductase family deazaflavin-dependent oxidoreductase [Mycobacterium sp.]